jgi:hypothetical protein
MVPAFVRRWWSQRKEAARRREADARRHREEEQCRVRWQEFLTKMKALGNVYYQRYGDKHYKRPDYQKEKLRLTKEAIRSFAQTRCTPMAADYLQKIPRQVSSLDGIEEHVLRQAVKSLQSLSRNESCTAELRTAAGEKLEQWVVEEYFGIRVGRILADGLPDKTQCLIELACRGSRARNGYPELVAELAKADPRRAIPAILAGAMGDSVWANQSLYSFLDLVRDMEPAGLVLLVPYLLGSIGRIAKFTVLEHLLKFLEATSPSWLATFEAPETVAAGLPAEVSFSHISRSPVYGYSASDGTERFLHNEESTWSTQVSLANLKELLTKEAARREIVPR